MNKFFRADFHLGQFIRTILQKKKFVWKNVLPLIWQFTCSSKVNISLQKSYSCTTITDLCLSPNNLEFKNLTFKANRMVYIKAYHVSKSESIGHILGNVIIWPWPLHLKRCRVKIIPHIYVTCNLFWAFLCFIKTKKMDREKIRNSQVKRRSSWNQIVV